MKVSIEAFEPTNGIPGEVRYEFSLGDILIGIALISTTSEFYFLHFITVMPDDRGKGYGSLMLQTICDKFNDKPIHLELDASSPLGLDKLRAWYEKYGFIYLGGENMVREASPLCRHFQTLWSR
ncbi:GNAT family N-acetyltransferase [Allocoleopsis franciscana]|uniref:Acetyltransferase n=1 Tax=Allocoleopsis franciscana PCC 7113 TaxID=1173027 RepID=K9WL97_9CYAN|nr:GNAT family N-acetyltransferase [Allocoleopsis franciscana]AFZ20968.1 acetyltransferase [Allocoleopsis franciscana PCC 7113]